MTNEQSYISDPPKTGDDPVAGHPAALSERATARGLRLSITASAVAMFFIVVTTGVPYSMLLDRLQASGKMQGVAAMIINLSLLSTLLSAVLTDRIGKRRLFWRVTTAIHRGMWIIPALLVYFMRPEPATAAIVIGIACVSLLIGNMGSAAWQSWMADLVPENSRGAFWSRRQMWCMVTFMVSIWFSGWLLDFFDSGNPQASMLGFTLVFVLATISGCADVAIHWSVPEPPAEPLTDTMPLMQRLVEPLRQPGFGKLALAMGFWGLSIAVIGPFGNLYLKRVVNATYTELSAIQIAATLSNIVAGFVAGYIIDRIGAKAMASVMVLICPLFGVAWFLITDAPIVITIPLVGITIATKQAIALLFCSTIIAAGFYSAISLSHLSLVAALAPRKGRTTAMAVQWTVIGLITALGSIIGGYVMDACGDNGFNIPLRGNTKLTFIHVSCALHAAFSWFVALPLFRSMQVANSISMRRAMAILLPANPLRFASGIYHGRIITRPATAERRLRSVKAVGQSGSLFAVQDLRSKLIDPSLDVREAAVASLGQIATNEAVKNLLEIINDHNSDLLVHALRAAHGFLTVRPESNSPIALLQAETATNWQPEIVSSVVPLLAHGNLEVVREAARLLRHTPSPRATAALTDLLHTTPHDAIALSAAASLGFQDDITAVYEIIPRMRAAANANEKVFAVAAANLMGIRDRFYTMLCKEEEAHNSALFDMIKELAASSQKLGPSHNTRFPAEIGETLELLEEHYEKRDLSGCAAAALRSTRLFAQHCYGIDAAMEVFKFLPQLEKHDPRFAAGAWFITLLNGAFARADAPPALRPVRSLTEVQLAVFILYSWAAGLARQ